MLRLTPSEVLTFPYGEQSECILDLLCVVKFPVTYKIQTTSPEKFRVRPRCGVILPGSQVSINVLLKPEHKLEEGSRDKFLIMAMPLPPESDGSPQQINDIWRCKQLNNSTDYEQHRICCQYKGDEESSFTGKQRADFDKNASGLDMTKQANENLSKMARKIERQMRNTQILQYLNLILLCMLGIAVGYLLKLELYGDMLDGSGTTHTSGDSSCARSSMHKSQ